MSSKKSKFPKISHDEFFKTMMLEKDVAIDFLTDTLPPFVKNEIDLNTIEIQKDSYIDDNLKSKICDLLFKVNFKEDKEQAYIYLLTEHQSKPDKIMAYRLLKYMTAIIDNHLEKCKTDPELKEKFRGKLPTIYTQVIYNRKVRYNAHTHIWDLFTKPEIAKDFFVNGYKVIDLASMSDDELLSFHASGLMQFFMKHAYERDLVKLMESAEKRLRLYFELDREKCIIYLKRILWYNVGKTEVEQKDQLEDVLARITDEKKLGEEIMGSLAEKWYEGGRNEGRNEGLNEGIRLGEEKIKKTALRLLEAGTDIKIISNATGLSEKEILNLRKANFKY